MTTKKNVNVWDAGAKSVKMRAWIVIVPFTSMWSHWEPVRVV